jgi:hypothetical protein
MMIDNCFTVAQVHVSKKFGPEEAAKFVMYPRLGGPRHFPQAQPLFFHLPFGSAQDKTHIPRFHALPGFFHCFLNIYFHFYFYLLF